LKLEEAESRLRDYLLNGIAAEIFQADQAYSLAKEIGRYAERINAANFGDLFGSLQIMLSDRQTLSIVKIFDSAKRYPTRSIPGTLDLLQSEAECWRLREPQRLRQVLTSAGSDASEVKQMDDVELNRAVVAHFRDTLPGPKRLNPDNLSLSLSALRQSRDKMIAHNEDINVASFQILTWGDATLLLNYAKHFVGTIGSGYLGLHFGESSENYHLSDDARRASNSLRRLLKVAGIVEDTRF
jgi:hypothetical protein